MEFHYSCYWNGNFKCLEAMYINWLHVPQQHSQRLGGHVKDSFCSESIVSIEIFTFQMEI